MGLAFRSYCRQIDVEVYVSFPTSNSLLLSPPQKKKLFEVHSLYGCFRK